MRKYRMSRFFETNGNVFFLHEEWHVGQLRQNVERHVEKTWTRFSFFCLAAWHHSERHRVGHYVHVLVCLWTQTQVLQTTWYLPLIALPGTYFIDTPLPCDKLCSNRQKCACFDITWTKLDFHSTPWEGKECLQIIPSHLQLGMRWCSSFDLTWWCAQRLNSRIRSEAEFLFPEQEEKESKNVTSKPPRIQ